MKNIILVVLVLIFSISSCSRNDDLDGTERLSGVYTEISPVEGRTLLTFVGERKVIRVFEGNSNSDEYTYEIIGNTIKFTSVGVEPITSELYFERIDESTFKVGNLYVSIPENPPVYLLFRKVGMTQ